ncbi:delta-12 fatty acid desaturase [Cyathus striatus]|nr:delta-12 fatty acid desaturase [Cyathus striatus]
MLSLFSDSPEYVQRTKTPFKPTNVTISEVHSVIPKDLYRKSTIKGLGYTARDISFAFAVYKLGRCIDPFNHTLTDVYGFSSGTTTVVKWLLWGLYWYWQGVILAGWWCIAHEAGHGTISSYGWVNHAVGFTLHTFVLVPYYSWRSTHHAHHKATMSIERDEHYMPVTRSQYQLPPDRIAHISDYHDIFEETPIYTLFRMLMMQILGWQCYLLTNVMGNPRYPSGTNHFKPTSALFKPHERNGIIASNIGLTTMIFILYLWTKEVGFSYFIKLYFIPYILCNHWIVMMTYLHHSDPTVPYYRKSEWNFLRGALSTVDRPLLGWAGRFFLHNVSHDHVSHHLFSSIPFYNQPKVTEILKTILKDDYNYDSTNSFRALYRTFTQCCFIEDNGDILFYKNREGKPVRVLAQNVDNMN